ncbi:hypothetical protein WJX73_003518 [Symbiochloris irregularis]|uniref:B30.2/SPRY domain-containing protein n=1 Tax=Symbiochloris irregularis TaxID=706552 RepID=A0AAW1P646_9CHLO
MSSEPAASSRENDMSGPTKMDREKSATAEGEASEDRRPAKRSKKDKRKAALTPAELETVAILPLPARKVAPPSLPAVVQVSQTERAPQIQLSDENLTLTFHKGYRMARATHGAYQGTWYFEVTMQHLGETGHCRLGWSAGQGELQAPVGYDAHSFAYRDLEGVKVHRALRQEYGKPFREGDVVGCFLHLPPGGRPLDKDVAEEVTWKGTLSLTDGGPQEPAKPLEGSAIAFTLNGVSQGIAFTDILEGTYFPAVSMYTMVRQTEGAKATFNFGPTFQFEPPQVDGYPAARPVSDLPVASSPQIEASAEKQSSPLAIKAEEAAEPDVKMEEAEAGADADRVAVSSEPDP